MIAASALRKTSFGLPAACTTMLAETIAIMAAPVPWRPPTTPSAAGPPGHERERQRRRSEVQTDAVVEEVELEIAAEDEHREGNREDDLDGSDHDPSDDRAQRNGSLPGNGFLGHPHGGGP